MTELAHATGRDRYRALRDALSNFSLMLGVFVVGLIILVVLFGPLIAPYNPYIVDRIEYPHYDFEEQVYIRVPVQPNADFPFGTDQVGMDILSLILHGARNTLIAGVLIAIARVVLGLFIGLAAGWFEGGLFDRLVNGLMGVLTSLPMLISGMILIFAIGIAGGMITFFLALTFLGWTEVAQYIRGEVLVARKMPYMESARSIGLREIEIAIRHVIPNILPQLFVISFLEVGAVLMLLGELALLGVFIGGGSSLDFSDIGAASVVAIPSQPEWGAMIASGFRWLRSNPHIVFFPAEVVFVAVLGFNALGEGLRSLFEKRGIKTSFIVSKRMLLILAAVFLVMGLIFRSTQPVRWFQDLAQSFSADEMAIDAEILASLEGLEPVPGRPAPYASYVAQQLKEYGFKGGVRWSDFYLLRSEWLFEPAVTPELFIAEGTVTPPQSFTYGQDFAYVMNSYGSAGVVEGNLALLRVWPDLDPNAIARLGAKSFEGQIVLLEEGNAPPEMAQAIISRGAAGLLWVAQPGAQLRDDRLSPAGLEEGATVSAPVFRINQATAEKLLLAANINPAAFRRAPNASVGTSLAPAVLMTEIRLTMQLALKEPVPIEITNMIAYHKGTDGRIGDEIIVFALSCDGLWRADGDVALPENRSPQACMAPLPIEFGRMFSKVVMDLKRPILVVLLGGGEFSYNVMTDWLSSRDNFSHLSAPGMSLQPRPAFLFQLAETQGTGAGMQISANIDPDLRIVLERATDWGKINLVEQSTDPDMPIWISTDFIPFQTAIGFDLQAPDAKQVGESLSLVMTRLLREAILTSN
ncbi:MAG: ABC transporter permease [Chloroflexi bacterium]|nr:ABC transporter permease [Chloroflexota bacterium]MQC26352.1 ABC transporter permease [Chloroflexota bacterium]